MLILLNIYLKKQKYRVDESGNISSDLKVSLVFSVFNRTFIISGNFCMYSPNKSMVFWEYIQTLSNFFVNPIDFKKIIQI